MNILTDYDFDPLGVLLAVRKFDADKLRAFGKRLHEMAYSDARISSSLRRGPAEPLGDQLAVSLELQRNDRAAIAARIRRLAHEQLEWTLRAADQFEGVKGGAK